MLAAWVGVDVLWAEDASGSAFLLDSDPTGSIRLCFAGGEGEYLSSITAASRLYLEALLEDTLPNGAAFAFSLPELKNCAPYSLVLDELPELRAVTGTGGLEEAASALAERFGINLGGQSRYTEADGTLVYPGETGVLPVAVTETIATYNPGTKIETENVMSSIASAITRRRMCDLLLSTETEGTTTSNAYENSPGVTVPRQSTRTKLTLTAHGGDDGCTFTLTVSDKLQRVPGSSSPPSSVSPGEDIEWSAYYEGVSASAQMNDATASATYTNLRTGETGNTGNITATVVEIELHPKLLVNNCPHRHMVGVCETVDCLHNPASFPIEWDATGDGMIIEENGLPVFVASVSGNSAQLSVANGGNPFFSNLPIVEPTGLLCSNQIIVVTNSVPQGVAGGIGMKLHLYVTPLTVSFANIAVEEVPCSTGNHSGYFANPAFAGCWSHTYAMGAGRWHDIQSGNYFGQDTSTSGDWPAPWSDGTMTWNIPIGWSYGETTNGDPEKNFPVQYLSAWTMDAEGTVSKSKHGHSVSRTTNDVVRLDGVIQ